MIYESLPSWAQTSLWVFFGFLLLVILVPPLRRLIGTIMMDLGLFKLIALPFVVILHEVLVAHRVIFMNLRPRIAVLPSIVERKQTNPTNPE